MNNSYIDISVVVPALNEAENLTGFLPRLKSCLSAADQCGEIIVVDGGSTDGTVDVARREGATVLIESETGFGTAIREGIGRASGKYVITMDGDGSHDPEYIPSLVGAAESADMVIASRYVPGGGAISSLFRNTLSQILNWCLRNSLSLPMRDISGGFRLYRKSIFDELAISGADFSIQAEIAVKAYARGFRVIEVPFEYRPRVHGMSKARIWKYGWSFVKTAFSLWRLRNTVYFADYDHRAFESRLPMQRLWHWQRYRLIGRFLERKEPALDVGCGSGKFILTSGAFGIDIDIAKARYVNQRGGRVVCGDASALPFKNDLFREVVCSEVVEHVPEGCDIFSELSRVMKPGGSLVLTTPDYGSAVWRTIERLYHRLLPGAYAAEHVTNYNRKRLLRDLRRSGFEILSTKRMFASVIVVKARWTGPCHRGPFDSAT